MSQWVSESVSKWVRATRVKLWSPETNDNFRHLETRWEWNCLQPNLTFFLSNINLSRITLTSHSMFNQICMKLQRLTNRPALQAISSFMAGDSCLQSYKMFAYLVFHLRTARVRSKSCEVTKTLGLLLETHDAVLVEHDEIVFLDPRSQHSTLSASSFSEFLTIFEALLQSCLTYLIPIFWCVTLVILECHEIHFKPGWLPSNQTIKLLSFDRVIKETKNHLKIF